MENDKSELNKKRLQAIVNWTLPGLSMYYRDTNLDQSIIDQYKIGMIFRSQTFVDVSNFAGRPTTNCRFIFASSKAAAVYKVNPATKRWGFHSINCNSYFKVLDIYKKEQTTQIFLIHIPYQGINFFSTTKLRLGDQDFEQQIIDKSRASLDKKLLSKIPAALNEKSWTDRTNFPIGLDSQNNFYALELTSPLLPAAVPMYTAIRKMTNDLTDINVPPGPKK